MKKFFVAFAMIMASMITMAQSQFYVILKDGTGASFPEAVVDSLTFENNGATIYGFSDIVDRLDKMQKTIDSLKKVLKNTLGEPEDDYEHDYVDLDLPSGLLWATTNVGAKEVNEIGYYFAFGETTAKKLYYSSSNYTYNSFKCESFIANNVISESNKLTEEHDPSTVFWGDEWMTPSYKDFQELVQYCTYEWTDYNGINGVKFTSLRNGNTLFIPCSGYMSGEKLLGPDAAYYMSSSISESGMCITLFAFQDRYQIGTLTNSHGKPVRPVKKTTKYSTVHDSNNPTINGYKCIDLGLKSGTLWSVANLDANNVPESSGSKIAWGELESKEEYTDENSLWFEYTQDELIEKGVIDESQNLTADNDIVSKKMGEHWKMPTKEDFEELIKECDIEYGETESGWKGIIVTGKNGNKMFLPKLYYWTSTAFGAKTSYGCFFEFETDTSDKLNPAMVHSAGRSQALYIRPVVRK